jgi:anti-sigma factor RsiW
MPKCAAIDPLVTPYVDGELADGDRRAVDEHLAACPPCRGRVLAERAVKDVMAERRAAMCGDRAPVALRARCAGLGVSDASTLPGRPGLPGARAAAWRRRLAPLALAATLVLVVGAAFLYQLTVSSEGLMAAELTADHMKCFAMNRVLGTHQSSDVVESSMASGFDWRVRLPKSDVPGEPEGADEAGLELVGSRPCLYGEGRVAHIMFRHNGTPVSLFMLPKTTRSDELVRVLGHEAAIWSVGDRTFVLIARETQTEVAHMAAFIQASLRDVK